ncbi:MAG TPA: arylsulfatase, partial [Planctomycetaceae bacterium]|nr:arylsulfatase [Planctomycetaceae bacterium]
TRKRMETVDEELIQEGIKFMDKAKTNNKPFFIWFATTRMHTFTRVPEEYRNKVKQHTSYHDDYGAGVIQHDEHVGMILKHLEDMGAADNTIVIYSTDNGVEHSTFPHGGTTPYRSEKMTTWEGGVRVPMMARWPGKIPPGSELNGIQSHEDVFTTLSAAAGVPDIRERIAKGDKLGTEVEHKNYIDGVNNLDYWVGKSEKSARDEFIYY